MQTRQPRNSNTFCLAPRNADSWGAKPCFPALPRAPSWVALTRGLCYCLLLRPHRSRVAAPHWRLRHVRNLHSRPRLSHGYRLPPAASLKPLHNGTNERDNVRRAALRFTSQPNGYGMHFPGPARFVQNPFVLVLSVEIQYRPHTHTHRSTALLGLCSFCAFRVPCPFCAKLVSGLTPRRDSTPSGQPLGSAVGRYSFCAFLVPPLCFNYEDML